MPLIGITAIIVTVWVYCSKQKRAKLSDNKKAVERLVNFIHQNELHLDFGHYEYDKIRGSARGAGKILKMTLFQVADLAKNKEINFTNEFDNKPLYFGKSINQIGNINIKDFIIDPLLPNEISTELSKFYNTGYHTAEHQHLEEKKVFVKIMNGYYEATKGKFDNEDKDRADLKLGNAIAFQSFSSFKLCCESLEDSIIIWNKSNKMGLTIRNDINIFET